MKFSDEYTSNILKLVDLKKYTFKGMKIYDCHVFMERLLPLAFRGLLPKPIVHVLTDLSNFFKAICSSKFSVKDMETLEGNIVLILCNLEKIFPPAFFDLMDIS